MRPLTLTRPKVLVPAAGSPLLDHVFRRLAVAGVDSALLVTMYLPDQVESWARVADHYGIDIDLVHQPRDRYGTGAATLTAREWVDGSAFLMTFGDVLASESHYPALVGLHRRDPDATILSAHREEMVRGGLVQTDGDGLLEAIIERPSAPVPSGLINAGIFLLQPGIFDDLQELAPSPRGEYELTDVFQRMADEGRGPRVLETDDYWVNVSGGPEILEVQRRVLDEWTSAADGDGVFIEEGAEVSGDAELRGPLRISAGASVGAAQIGPYASVGNGAHVGDESALEECGVLPGAYVGSGCRLRYAIIGAGARMADRARLWGEVDRTSILADGEEHGT
jgi:bifunctional UDP-N-acetylglucosamine pyrophosphorylase/glucosamine-1-phosphate N-acetyltransferase